GPGTRHQGPKDLVYSRACAITIAIVSTIIVPAVTHETTLYQRELMCLPISSASLIKSSTKTSTNGSSTPFATCDRTMTRKCGKCGTSTTPAPKTISAVYSQ